MATNTTVFRINTSVILDLANAETPNDEFTKMLGTEVQNSELAEAIRAASAEDRKVKVQAAAKEIVSLIAASGDDITSTVAKIRSLRAEEKRLLERVRSIETAKAYGQETMNFVPLTAILTGNPMLLANPKSVIPANFKPKKKSGG